MNHKNENINEKSCCKKMEKQADREENNIKYCENKEKTAGGKRHEKECACKKGEHLHGGAIEGGEHDRGHGHGCGCDHKEEHHHDHCGSEHDHCGCGCDHEHGERLESRAFLRYVAGAVLLLLSFLGELSVLSPWIAVPAAIAVYVYFGVEVWCGAINGLRGGRPFTEQMLMCVATVGAAALLEFADAAAVMYLYSLGELIQGAAYRKSRENIADLIEITEEYINKVENGSIRRVAASTARIGDIISVTVGEKISLDGIVVDGSGFADTAAITGESVPRELAVGTECLSGSVLVAGAVSVRVTECFEHSTANKMKAAVERASRQ